MTVLQASLIYKSPISPAQTRSNLPKHPQFHRFNPLSLSFHIHRPKLVSNSQNNHPLLFRCALHPGNVDSSSEFQRESFQQQQIPDEGEELSVENVAAEEEGMSGWELVESEDLKGKLPLVVFLMGLVARVRAGFEKMLMSDWFSWLRLWRQEKLLERLTLEADANPKNAAKQTALLVELNKHSPESVIKRFEQMDYSVDSRGVAEYIRALVATNSIAEYLPDEQSGKPSSLPALLQELKQRATGNMDEPILTPEIFYLTPGSLEISLVAGQ